MSEKITIQQVWASPDGKVRVITTPEQRKLNCYNLALFQYLGMGGQIEVDTTPGTKKDGTPITKIVNVWVNGQPILKEEKPLTGTATGSSLPEVSGEEKGMWWKQLGDDLRSGHIDRNSSIGKALRLTYFAQMFKVLNIDLKELQESETQTSKTSKPATAGTQLKTKSEVEP